MRPSGRQHPELVLRYLLGCRRLLVAYDVDAEGEKGAERLAQLSARMQRIRPPVGKDVTASVSSERRDQRG